MWAFDLYDFRAEIGKVLREIRTSEHAAHVEHAQVL
jgi:hypothetical protein